jgi:hypothetical protein
LSFPALHHPKANVSIFAVQGPQLADTSITGAVMAKQDVSTPLTLQLALGHDIEPVLSTSFS